MSDADLREELEHPKAEPLLPVEKKLIGWSLGLGVALLGVLLVLGTLYPPNV
jgi:hypothetical protein